MTRRRDNLHALIEAARQAGYDDGYVDGGNARLEELLAWTPRLTVDSAAHQFGQQVKISEAS